MRKKGSYRGEKCHSPERAGDGGDEKEADRHENGAHLHPLRIWQHLQIDHRLRFLCLLCALTIDGNSEVATVKFVSAPVSGCKNESIRRAERTPRFTRSFRSNPMVCTSSANPILDMCKGVRVCVCVCVCASRRLGPLNVNLSFPRVNREDSRTEITGRRCTRRANSIGISTSAKNTLQIQL